MGVTRAAPWWLTWALLGGLVLVFAGERILEASAAARAVATGLGTLVVIGCAAWRVLSWRVASDDTRSVETLLLAAYGGVLVALALYAASTDAVLQRLGIEFASDAARGRYRTVLHVLWPIVMAASLLPALGAQIALGAHRHARAAGAGLESLRVRGTATAGLTIALAGGFLFVTGYVTHARDRTVDLSYFRTSSPSEATRAMVDELRDPLQVLLFFPDVNPVKDEVLRYFRALDAGPRVDVQAHDRLSAPVIAREHRVSDDGTIVLVSGERSQTMMLPTDLNRARPMLRALDGEVQQHLMALLRERRTFYLTSGHGELNDPESAGPLMEAGLGGIEGLRQLLHLLNYDVMDLGLRHGLGQDVPDDAAAVAILGPRRAFLPEELEALDRYLERGGALLIALDPEGEFELGPLENRLGVRFVPESLADETQHLRQRGGISDRRLIITDRFSAHPAVTTASRAGIGSAVLFVGPGHLEEAEGPMDPETSRSFIARSLPSTFADRDGTFEFDPGTEERRSYNLVAAVESQDASRPMRALVYADAGIFTDGVVGVLGLNAALVADGIKWVGGEEALAGIAESEEDVPIVHTRAEDVAWFYSTILGAPALVLTLGLLGVYRRRRRRGEVAG